MAERQPGNPDRFVASSQLEKKLYRAGVPQEFWEARMERVSFMATPFAGSPWSGVAQRHWIRTVLKQPPRRAPLIVAASAPTDFGALHFGFAVVKTFLQQKHKNVAIVDVAQPIPYFENYPHCLLLHNILDKSTDERREKVRDVLSRFSYALRVVIVAGVTQPEKWTTTRLGLYPQGAIRVRDLTRAQLTAE